MLEEEDFSLYLSKTDRYLSSHQLGDFRKSPAILAARRAGEIQWKKSAAFALGTAAHKLILEGPEAYAADYTVGDGPVNPKTGAVWRKNSIAYRDWLAAQTKKIISLADDFDCKKMAESVSANAEAALLLTGGQAEGVLRGELYGVDCQIRCDYYTLEHGFVDLKTCRNLDDFEEDAIAYGYMHQMAFYHTMLSHHGYPSKCHIVAVEKSAPYRSGVWRCEALPVGEVRRDIEAYARCAKGGVWPTGYETTRIMRGTN